jgi:acyl carrier protein
MIELDEIFENIYSLIEVNQGCPIEKRHKEFNFVKDGHLDSFALLSFIMDVEQIYSIQLSSDELQSEEIHLVEGLVEIIIYKQNNPN